MRRLSIIIITVSLIATCLYALTTYSNETEPKVVEVRMNEFRFKPESILIKSGQIVKIELVNDGKTAHEFMVGRTVKTEEGGHMAHGSAHKTHGDHHSSDMGHEDDHGMSDSGTSMSQAGMTKGFETDFFEGIDIEHTVEGGEFMRVPNHGTMVRLNPGGKATLVFEVPDDRKGEWQVACFVPGHFEAGMQGKIIIE